MSGDSINHGPAQLDHGWVSIKDELPPDARGGERRYVLLAGDSGMAGQRVFVTLGYLDTKYRPPIHGVYRLLDVCNDNVQHQAFTVTHWRHVDLRVPGLPHLPPPRGSR